MWPWEQNVQLWSESSKVPRNLENCGPPRAVLLLTSEGGSFSIRTTNVNTINTVLYPYSVHMPCVLYGPCSKQLSFLHTRLTDWSFKWTRTMFCLRYSTSWIFIQIVDQGVDKVALVQVFLWVLRCHSTNVPIPTFILIFLIRRTNRRPLAGEHWTERSFFSVLSAYSEVHKATVSFVMSICMEHFGFHWFRLQRVNLFLSWFHYP